MQTWLKVDEFCQLAHLDRASVESLIEKGELTIKKEDEEVYIETTVDAFDIIPSKNSIKNSASNGDFVEKTIGTILGLHERVLDAKDETLEALKSENRFLKEALFSMQELYDEDRETVETLTTQLKNSQEEIEFLKRKYKLMWNQAVENYKKES